jgi:lipopolysaccharide transport protein LptA
MIAAAAVLVLGLVRPAPAAEDQVPVRITADKMTYSEEGRRVTFTGRVKVVRGDLVVRSSKLVARFSQGAGAAGDISGQAQRIKEIVATDAVRLNYQGRKGTCRRMVYDVKNGILRMEGDPKLKEKRNVVQGEVIKFYLKDYRSEVLGGEGQRVEATFFAPGELTEEQQ